MKTLPEILELRWRDCANVLLGAWLVGSPWVLGHAGIDHPTWNAWALGAAIAISALAALVEFHEWEAWVSTAFGAWLIIGPWLLGYTGLAAATWNHVLVGLAVAGMAAWSIWHSRRHPHAALNAHRASE